MRQSFNARPLCAVSQAPILIGIASIALVAMRTLREPEKIGWNKWAFYEWLINYRGGFVRRGILGEGINLYFYGNEIEVVNCLVFFNFVIFVLSVLAFCTVVLKDLRAALLFLMAPFSVLWMAVSGEHFYRKEILFYALIFTLASFTKLHSEGKEKWKWFTIAATFLSSLFLPLVHEAFIFFAGPVLFASLKAVTRHSKPHSRTMLLLMLCGINLLQLITSYYYHGNLNVAQDIWSSLSTNAKAMSSGGGLDGGISSVSWSFRDAISLPVAALLSGTGTYYIFALLAAFFITSTTDAIRSKSNVYSACFDEARQELFLKCCLLFLPLFALGWDWGRWCVGISLLFTSLIAFSDIDLCWIARIKFNKEIIFYAFLLVSLLSRVPECCLGGPGNGLPASFIMKRLRG
jgi:hypothetical protein